MAAHVVLDASAVLALLQSKPGWDVVASEIGTGAMSAINAVEVMTRLIDRSAPDPTLRAARALVERLSVPFDHRQAMRAAELRRATRPLGLSLADRCCLALAITESLPVLTADRAWASLDIGVQIRVVR